ncbi:MAG TPA: preprotein translocase subunit YajC [Nocardioidaceae bacterium]|nr:preprotein translocase subunit YajC [Nocardioidaceae bacterium]
MESLGAVLPLLLLAVLGYFLLIRPTRRRAQEVSAIQSALGVDAEVMLTSGIFGTVTAIEADNVLVEVAPGVVLTVHRGAISKVLTRAPSAEATDETDSIDADSTDADSTDSLESTDGPETDHESRGAN